MHKYVVHMLSIADDDPLFRKFGNYLLSLAYEIEVKISHDTKTYLCHLDQGQYNMFIHWLGGVGNEELKAKVMEQINN